MNLKFLIGVSIVLIATWSFRSPAPRDSGIEGQVLIGPMCPVVQQGEVCTDQPYQATLTVKGPNGGTIAQIPTDAQGHFRFSLAPGQYLLHPESPNGFPVAGDQWVVVGTAHYTQLSVHYDSGIR
jgi:hypothetical protein